MNELLIPASTTPPPPRLEVRDARVSSIIIQRVPPASTEAFLEWQRGMSRAAEAFPGYRGTDLYPPSADGQQDWVVILQFNSSEDLKGWLDSPTRAEWGARVPQGLGAFRVKSLQTGFGSWFAKQLDDAEGQPPAWKMVLTVLLGLYPTVMLLSLIVGPSLARFGMATSMLVGNALSVSILQWGVMPILQPLLHPWLALDANASRARSIGWLALILAALVVQVVLFRQLAG